MSEAGLRGALDLLFGDEPVIDLYSYGPWRVRDGLVEELSARIDALVADERSSQFTVSKHPELRTPVPAVVADAQGIVAFLCGDVAIRAGSRMRIDVDVVRRFRLGPNADSLPAQGWIAPAAPWRPPGGQLFRAAGDDRARREVAWDLTIELLRRLEGLAPLEPRREALLRLHTAARRDPDLVEATLTAPQGSPDWTLLEERWAEAADDEVVALVPELTGPVGYLSWIVDGWMAAHERLNAMVPGGGDADAAFIQLLIQAGVVEPPAELAVGIRGELYASVRDQLPVRARQWKPEPWQRQIRAWLSRALVAGQFQLCRAWLDLAVRLTGVVQGLPGTPVTPRDCRVPVTAFQEDVRRLTRVRRVRHPLTGGAAMPGWVAVEHAFPFGPAPGVVRASQEGPRAAQPRQEANEAGANAGREAHPAEQLSPSEQSRPSTEAGVAAPTAAQAGGKDQTGPAEHAGPAERPGEVGDAGVATPSRSADDEDARPSEAVPTREDTPPETRGHEGEAASARGGVTTEDVAETASDDTAHHDSGHHDSGHHDTGHVDTAHVDVAHEDAGHEQAGQEDAGQEDAGQEDAAHRDDDAHHDAARHDPAPGDPAPGASLHGDSLPGDSPHGDPVHGDTDAGAANVAQVGEPAATSANGARANGTVNGTQHDVRAVEAEASPGASLGSRPRPTGAAEAASRRPGAEGAETAPPVVVEPESGGASGGEPAGTAAGSHSAPDGASPTPPETARVEVALPVEERPVVEGSTLAEGPDIEEPGDVQGPRDPAAPAHTNGVADPDAVVGVTGVTDVPGVYGGESHPPGEPHRRGELHRRGEHSARREHSTNGVPGGSGMPDIGGEPGADVEPATATNGVNGVASTDGRADADGRADGEGVGVAEEAHGESTSRAEPASSELVPPSARADSWGAADPTYGGEDGSNLAGAVSADGWPGAATPPSPRPDVVTDHQAGHRPNGHDTAAGPGEVWSPGPSGTPEGAVRAAPLGPSPGQANGRVERMSPRARAMALIDRIVGQAALVSALREIVMNPDADIRLVVAGPPGTGRSLAVEVAARTLTVRGFDGTAVWLRHEHFANADPTTAVAELRACVEGCLGRRLLAIHGIDQLIARPHNGAVLAAELHRLISVHGSALQIVAFAASDGYRRMVDVSPALAAWWRVVRTHDFDASEYAVVFGRVVEQRGATTTEETARWAGELLATRPPDPRLRNARLATYVADLAVDAARRRTRGAARPMVEIVDLPQFEGPPLAMEQSHPDVGGEPGVAAGAPPGVGMSTETGIPAEVADTGMPVNAGPVNAGPVNAGMVNAMRSPEAGASSDPRDVDERAR